MGPRATPRSILFVQNKAQEFDTAPDDEAFIMTEAELLKKVRYRSIYPIGSLDQKVSLDYGSGHSQKGRCEGWQCFSPQCTAYSLETNGGRKS